MKTPLNIGAMPPLSASISAVLTDPVRHLFTAVDPDLAFGRLSPRGADEAVTALPVIILLMKGKLALCCEGAPVQLVAGETAVQIASGCRLEWIADDACDIIVIADPRLAFAGQIARIDLSAPVASSSPPSSAVLLGPAPQCASATLFDTSLMAFGLWSATPYARRAVPMAVSEIMYLLGGTVTLATPDGKSFHFETGDVLLAPLGAELAWDNAAPVRKLFISAKPDPAVV